MPITLSPSPSSTDLITSSRALLEPALADLNTANASALAPLISAASRAIERTCKRRFGAADYVLHLSIGPRSCDWIALPNFPVISISRLASNPQPALSIANVDNATNQRAAVSTTTAGAVRLTTIATGVATTTDLSMTTYPTIGALATAVNALGHGWSATTRGGFDSYPSADLRPMLLAQSATQRPAVLDVFTDDLPAWQSSQAAWDWAEGCGSSTGWQLDPDAGLIVGRFADALDGPMPLRCDYRAGFETIPQDIQQACARLAALIAEDQQRNSTVMLQTVGPYTQRFYPAAAKLVTNPAVVDLIRPYIDHAKTISHLWP